MGEWQRRLLGGYRPGRLGQNTLFGTAGLGLRAIIQVAYLLIVSRWLGAEGYGLFAGSVAIVIFGAPLANWGSALLITRYIAQDRSSSRAIWATALVQTGVIGSLLVVATLAVTVGFLPQRLPLTAMLLLALSELLLLPATHAATSQCYALERGGASAMVICLVPLGRTLTMLGVIALGFAGSPEHAALAHFGGTLLGFVAAAIVVAYIDGFPAWRSRLPLRTSIAQGHAYAVSNVAGTSYQEVDKVLILQIFGAAALGPYSVAFRMAGVFLMPITALVSAALPRLMAAFRHDGARTYRVMLLTGVSYGALAGVAMVIAAPWVPYLFGDDYILATQYLSLLAPWPALFALRQCLATHLTATNRQPARSSVEMTGLGLVLLLNALLLQSMGPGGAILALLLAEAFVSIAMALLVGCAPFARKQVP